MEGELNYYKGVVSGFKKVYALIDSSDFVAFKGNKKEGDFKEILRVPLEKQDTSTTEVYPSGKGNTQFMLVLQVLKPRKEKKFYFKAASHEVAMLWIKCINKFYILDLQPHNSFVRYCVEQGQNVFLISWANPTPEQGDISWDDYVGDGVIRAIDLVREITDVPKINTVAWCIGGTLLSTALAVLADRKVDSVGSATFLTTLTDFEDAGDLCVFIDETQVKQLEGKVKSQGYLSGKELATSFNLLRSNDLIWSYVVNNYLKGQTPPPFDILYWNSDSTNLPAEMYTYYLKNMYLENKLSKPNALTVCGSKVDLGNIKIPCYFLSTIEDHIAPWKGTFKATETFGTDIEFTLGASGHVAGVINPVSKNRRHYWVKGEQGKGPEHWLETAERQEGSWWANWQEWLRRRAGKKVDAPKALGDKKHAPIEAAPGRYVAVRIN